MISRRQILKLVPTLGISSAVFARALAQEAAGKPLITQEMIDAAKWVSGIELTDEQERALITDIDSLQKQIENLRMIELDPQDDGPALIMQPLTKNSATAAQLTSAAVADLDVTAEQRPTNDEDLAFLPAYKLAALLKSKQITSTYLTTLYLDRLKRYDPQLLCVVNLTEQLALKQAARADEEIAAGKYRGPLHGIPFGAKDLISVEGYPTTWGIPVFEDRVIPQTATVIKRLFDAGAVLVAKLSLGAIAMGDKWFRGVTRNPWNLEQGSSGSSAGSCSASSAGLVGFALGSETLGSILTPSARCASHGLRPTFGRVSRAGCMPLSWSMDKIGPIGRSVQDLAIVLAAIQGPDGIDYTVQNRPFEWGNFKINFGQLKVGVVKRERPDPALEIIRQMGCQVKEIELPKGYPFQALTKIIDIEAAAVFDTLLREGKTEGWNSWTKAFQTAQFITAIDYLRMQRVRRKLMFEFDEMMQEVDLLFNAGDLFHTNFTGHPSVTVPYLDPSAQEGKKPTSVVFTGRLFDEQTILAVAQQFESQASKPLPRPKI